METDSIEAVREAALRLLAHRARTVAELRVRLTKRGFAPELVAECLATLQAQRLLDDGAFAEGFARERARYRPRGRRRVVDELRARGVEEAVAAAAVELILADEGADELSLARHAARGWRARQGEERARAARRLAAFLSRRGFTAEVAREVVAERLGRS